VVELVDLTAAALAAAAAIRGLKGSSERYGLAIVLAGLKLPTGAITALAGLLLMRGQFVPGLSALDTSAQILAWPSSSDTHSKCSRGWWTGRARTFWTECAGRTGLEQIPLHRR